MKAILALGTLLVLAGGRCIAHAAGDPVNVAIMENQTLLSNAFPNDAGYDKLFRLAGTVNIFEAPTTVNIRFCWNPVANAAAPSQCSQVIRVVYAAGGLGQPIDTGNYLLAGPCPRTVWLEVRPTKSIDLNGTLTHTCNPGAIVPGPTPIVPQDLTACPKFPFLVRTTGKVGNGGMVDGGIGANDPGGFLKFGKGVFMTDGRTIAGDTVVIGSDSSVFDTEANTLRMGLGATVRGTSSNATLPLTTPFCEIPTFTCGGTDVVVPSGVTSGPLAPGSYGDLMVGSGATLELGPGTFTFCSVRTTGDATIRVTGPTMSTVNVTGHFRLGNGGVLAPVAGTPTPVLNVAGTLTRVGAGSTLQAYVSAPNAVMSIGREGVVKGSFCADRSRSDKDITLTCLGPPCGNGIVEGSEECDPPDFLRSGTCSAPAAGSSCTLAGDCSRCTAPAAAAGRLCVSNTDCGVCSAGTANRIGTACRFNSECGAGGVCNHTGSVCTPGTCTLPDGSTTPVVCNGNCRWQALSDFCPEPTPIVPPGVAMRRCVFPPWNYGLACNVDADCDTNAGAGDGICNPRQHRGRQRPLQGGWNAFNARGVSDAPTCLRLCVVGAAGASCSANADCNAPQDGVCNPGQDCLVNANCDVPPGAGNGVCGANFRCQAPALCRAPAANVGNACANDRACDSVQNGVCQAANQACTEDADCPSGACDGFGTLGSFPRRNTNNQFVSLSNNHVFALASGNIAPPAAAVGEVINQPPVHPLGVNAGSLADYEWLCFSRSCTAPAGTYGRVCTANANCDVAGGDGVCSPAVLPGCPAAGGFNQVNRIGSNCIDAAIAGTSAGAPVLDSGDILDARAPTPFGPSTLPPATCEGPTPKFGQACTTDTECEPGVCIQHCDSTLSMSVINRVVKKSGARTGLTCGRVERIDVATIPYSPVCIAPPARVGANCDVNADCNTAPGNGVCLQRPAEFRNQWYIRGIPPFVFNGHFSCQGDSGSLIVGAASNQPVGLLFAGNAGGCNLNPGGSDTIANPIDIVLGRFKTHF